MLNTGSNHYRKDIQGLRAIAVVSVILFHLWPEYISGGYVGVDVFFVISGYLITGKLLKDIDRFGQISLSSFYQARIRRLLPAATLVLFTVFLLMPFLPTVEWHDVFMEIAASTFYV